MFTKMKKLLAWKNFKKLADLKITFVCLMLLFVLTLWGTFYQYNYGLYAAQKKFFHSWFFLFLDFIPFIGAKTVLLVLFVNLLAASLFRYKFKLNKLGILTIHYGLLFLILSSFYTHYASRESVIVFEEGEELNYSLDYFDSELVVYVEKAMGIREVVAYDFNSIQDGEDFYLPKFNLRITPIYFYSHSTPGNFDDQAKNASGINSLLFLPLPKERESTLPGGVFRIKQAEYGVDERILLWEGERDALALEWGGRTHYFKIQRKHYPLPFSVKLREFEKKEHFGTSIAKVYQSEILYRKGDEDYPALIAMNEPFRSDGYTLFQSSFSVDESGNERSVLATVKNRGYYLPYAASLIISLGLLIHFLIALLKRAKLKR